MARNRHNWDNANVNALNAEKWGGGQMHGIKRNVLQARK